MSSLLLENEPFIRLAMFLGVLGAMAAWEIAAPRRRQDIPRLLRWTNNLGLVVVDTIIVRLVFPIAAVGLALFAEQRGWGLINAAGVPAWFAVPASVAVIYTDYLKLRSQRARNPDLSAGTENMRVV